MSSILVVGGSGGLGQGVVDEHLRRGWNVVATVRRDKERRSEARLTTELLDTTDWAAVDTLADRFQGPYDRLFVIAGRGGPAEQFGAVDPDEFADTMLVNALAPLRIIDKLADRVTERGMIAVMTSTQGSVAMNDAAGNERTGGGRESYRLSKAAVNMGLRSIAMRRNDQRTYLAVNPGWVRTAIGSDDAAMSVQESVAQVADVLDARDGSTGSLFIDHDNQPVAW